jgi:hypothetical protein
VYLYIVDGDAPYDVYSSYDRAIFWIDKDGLESVSNSGLKPLSL